MTALSLSGNSSAGSAPSGRSESDPIMPTVPADRHLRASQPTHRPAYSLRALGRRELPERLDVNGTRWQLERTVKHDFWAATGFYLDESGHRAVLKIGRDEPFAGVPLDWAGRFLCRRELRFYRRQRN